MELESSVEVPGVDFCSLNQLLYTRAKRQTDLFALGVPDKNLKFTRYTFGQINTAASLLAHHYAAFLPVRAVGDLKTEYTIGLLAPSGLDYVITEHALMRMGYCVLLISVNNSPAAIAHLLQITKSSHIITHASYAEKATKAVALQPPNVTVPIIHQANPEIYSPETRAINPNVVWQPRLSWMEEADLPALIIHSSGSTGFPKPIVISHRAAIRNVVGAFSLRSLTTLPLYHNHGHACLHRAFFATKPIFLFPASTLPLTAANLLRLLNQPECDPEALFAVPYVYKLLGEEEGVKKLQEFKLCLFGGSAMPVELGDKLVNAGVKLGITETGQLMTSFRDYDNDKDWIWLRLRGFAPFAIFEDQGDGTCELIVLDGWPSKNSSNRLDGSYATNDLFVRHPTKPDFVRFVGRVDDTLVLVNGEKVNPVPIELTLKGESPYILDAVVFGSGRHQTGALIVPTDLAKSKSNGNRTDLLKLIDPALRLANSAAPSHAQVMPEMIVFLPEGAMILKADKGSLLRPRTYAAFKDVIDDAYKCAEGGLDGQDGENKRSVGTVSEMEMELVELVSGVSGKSKGLEIETDLFMFGVDSLQAGRIRNFIQRTFDLKGYTLSNNFVFEKPTIHAAATYLVALTSGEISSLKEPTQVEQMLQLVEKYRHFKVPTARPDLPSNPSIKVVVLTGVTGSLGAYLLAELLVGHTVEKVYCLCRAKDDADAAIRIRTSMRARNLLHTMDGEDDKRVIALASDLGADLLGLKQAMHAEIVACATLIIHNAWSVNFNLGISSFEPHIRGVFNLMNLGLASNHQASFYFSSSVSAVAAWPGPEAVPEEITADPNVAQEMGPLKVRLLVDFKGIGQMVGSTVDGTWNETEAVSLMIKSAETLHVLPDLQEDVSWLPIDYAAGTIMDLASAVHQADSGEPECWNVVQPRTVPWSSVLNNLKAVGLKFEVVPAREWVDRLRRGPQDPVANPTVKLLTFYESKYDPPVGVIVPKRSPLQTDKTAAASRSLREAPIPEEPLVRKWVEAWRKTGFLIR
ncbi:hypothetical protein FRB97_001634 [Tulasnella sp. 331]|nr:hypothetical protein FRB97_001634 [Tulasnella sp. 331]